MAIPDFQSFMLPVLKLASKDNISARATVKALEDEFQLTRAERKEKLASGRQTRVANRVYWSFVHLSKAGLLKRIERGVYEITAEGKKVLAEKPERIDLPFLLGRYESYRQFRNITELPTDQGTSKKSGTVEAQSASTPEEQIENAIEQLNGALLSDLYERLQATSDTDFEFFIVELMKKLGYGAKGLAERTGGPGDGAIDGVISEDLLGLDIIYLQAKRYTPSSRIGPDKVREFAGAMDAFGVHKGVFVTTSSFTKAASDYAERSHKRLKLIDGMELTQLMLQHNIGVREHRLFSIKKIDSDFFEGLGE